MEPTDLTVKILQEIRDAVQQTNARIDQTNERLDQTATRLEKKIDVLADRIVESEIRTATAITALSGTLDDVKQLLRERLDMRDRLEHCEHDIILIKERVGIR